MNTVIVIAPEGQDDQGKEHTIPESDLQGFLDNGWTLAKPAKEGNNKGTKPAKADVTKQD
jgi:hypothetical protein